MGSSLWIGYGYYHWFLDDIDEPNLGESAYEFTARLNRIEHTRETFWMNIWRVPLAVLLFGSGVYWAGQQMRDRRRKTFD